MARSLRAAIRSLRDRGALDARGACLAFAGLVSVAIVVPSVAGSPGIGILLAMAVIGAVLWLRGRGLRELGFARPGNWPRTIALGIALGGLVQLASVMALEPLIERLTGMPLDLSAFDAIRGNAGALAAWLAIVWVLVVFTEEVIFRGFLMTELRKVLGERPAMLAANLAAMAVLFGLAHWYQGASGVLATGIVGLLLGIVFVRARFNLWLPILVHGFIDTVGLTLIYLNADHYLKAL